MKDFRPNILYFNAKNNSIEVTLIIHVRTKNPEYHIRVNGNLCLARTIQGQNNSNSLVFSQNVVVIFQVPAHSRYLMNISYGNIDIIKCIIKDVVDVSDSSSTFQSEDDSWTLPLIMNDTDSVFKPNPEPFVGEGGTFGGGGASGSWTDDKPVQDTPVQDTPSYECTVDSSSSSDSSGGGE
jgi:hypothetical protein